MAKVTEPNNLPSPSTAWARQVSDGVNALDVEVARFTGDQTNLNRANNANIQRLAAQAIAIQETQDQIVAQQAQIVSQQAYLASLVTVGVTGATVNSGAVPGDSTYRWTPFTDTTFDISVPTGSLLCMFGVGQVTLNTGNGNMIGAARFRLSSPSGWNTAIGGATRYFLKANDFGGVPLSSVRVVNGVPTDEVITVALDYGTWSAATDNTSNGEFAIPYLTAQVIPTQQS